MLPHYLYYFTTSLGNNQFIPCLPAEFRYNRSRICVSERNYTHAAKTKISPAPAVSACACRNLFSAAWQSVPVLFSQADRSILFGLRRNSCRACPAAGRFFFGTALQCVYHPVFAGSLLFTCQPLSVAALQQRNAARRKTLHTVSALRGGVCRALYRAAQSTFFSIFFAASLKNTVWFVHKCITARYTFLSKNASPVQLR